MASYERNLKDLLMGVKEGTQKHREITESWDKEQREKEDRIRKKTEEREYVHKAAVKILHLIGPVKGLSKSKLMNLKRAQLDEIGKGARIIYDEMEKAGMIEKNTIVYRSGD